MSSWDSGLKKRPKHRERRFGCAEPKTSSTYNILVIITAVEPLALASQSTWAGILQDFYRPVLWLVEVTTESLTLHTIDKYGTRTSLTEYYKTSGTCTRVFKRVMVELLAGKNRFSSCERR
eukprot:scaffold12994_cov128-Cylindrotheca_fusiformis.AAC.2